MPSFSLSRPRLLKDQCAHARAHAQTHPTVARPVRDFLHQGVERRIMALRGYKSAQVTIDRYEIFSTIAIMPEVRTALLDMYAQDEQAVIGDLQSLQDNVPIVYVYEPLQNKWGKNMRGRPRKRRVHGA